MKFDTFVRNTKAMTYTRKNNIPPEQLEIIERVAKQVKQLRLDKNLSIERFCSTHQIPRITYGNIEKGTSSFQITTLLSILQAHQKDIKSFINII
jgi:hypothetical protein